MTQRMLGGIVIGLFIATSLVGAGCQSPKGDSVADKRLYTNDMRTEVLEELYAAEPGTREKGQNAAGYGVFTNLASKIFVLATGSGYGVIRDNETGADTYMKMVELGGGIGIGVKKFRAVFIFNDADAMHRFVESGWEFGGDADAAAQSGDSGGGVGAAGTSGQLDGLEIYQMTDTGVALSATAAGTKYYKDDELNQ